MSIKFVREGQELNLGEGSLDDHKLRLDARIKAQKDYEAKNPPSDTIEGRQLAKIKSGESVTIYYVTDADRLRKLAQKEGIKLNIKHDYDSNRKPIMIFSLKK
ncbi:hypothetical protein SP15_265 [Bacillus phage SP-15]|uniref:Uncharacterized protein n=1 Tax=Bacillus phage SP-15 TaxID=1792032 RepID=A0A127AWU9_9CAUD|nr:hypothetical protein SP15_265 [Bacillus phage SP-15]AMM45072.1 hypothetical protein SP15_265 [Bacillus phage SP-15]